MTRIHPDDSLEQSPDFALIRQHKLLLVNCVTCSVAYVKDQDQNQGGLLTLLGGEKVVMRSIFVAAIAAACVLVANVASAENTCVRRPLVTVAPTPVGAPVLTVEVGGN